MGYKKIFARFIQFYITQNASAFNAVVVLRYIIALTLISYEGPHMDWKKSKKKIGKFFQSSPWQMTHLTNTHTHTLRCCIQILETPISLSGIFIFRFWLLPIDLEC